MRRTAWGGGWSSNPPRGTRDEGEGRKSRPLPTRPSPPSPRPLNGPWPSPRRHVGGSLDRPSRARRRAARTPGTRTAPVPCGVRGRRVAWNAAAVNVPPRGPARRGGATGRGPDPAQTARSWYSVAWREGSQGGMWGRFVAVRGRRVTSSGRRRAGWLIGEDASDGKAGIPGATSGRLWCWSGWWSPAHRRHWVEHSHEEAKGPQGRDQDQGRLWRGFHRHAVSVLLASASWFGASSSGGRSAARPGRPRRAFSPSAGSSWRVPAGGASADLRLAPPRSGQGVAVA